MRCQAVGLLPYTCTAPKKPVVTACLTWVKADRASDVHYSSLGLVLEWDRIVLKGYATSVSGHNLGWILVEINKMKEFLKLTLSSRLGKLSNSLDYVIQGVDTMLISIMI